MINSMLNKGRTDHYMTHSFLDNYFKLEEFEWKQRKDE